MTNPFFISKEKGERILSPVEASRSGVVYRCAEENTLASLERQLGLEVVDAETLSSRGVATTAPNTVLQNVMGVPRPEDVPVPPTVVMDPTDRALEELGYGEPATAPLPGFDQQAPMPPIDSQDNYRLAA